VILYRNAYERLFSQENLFKNGDKKMLGERYSITVSDYEIEIHGEITIREAFDLIHYFDQQGYTHLTIGHENSTMRIIKESNCPVPQDQPDIFEVLFNDQKETCRQIKEKSEFQEKFIQEIIRDDELEIKRLNDKIDKLCKEKKMNELMQNSLVNDMFNKLQEGTQNEK
jgi:hypothetical protein